MKVKCDPHNLTELKRAIKRKVRGISRETCGKVHLEAGRGALPLKKTWAFRARVVAVRQWSLEMPDLLQNKCPKNV